MNDQGFVEAQHALTLIQKYLGPTFTLTQLLDFIAFCREKDGVRVEEQSLPIGKWAYCFAFQDVDLIVVRQGLEPLRWLQACLHECAHFLLQHIPRVSARPSIKPSEAMMRICTVGPRSGRRKPWPPCCSDACARGRMRCRNWHVTY